MGASPSEYNKDIMFKRPGLEAQEISPDAFKLLLKQSEDQEQPRVTEELEDA
jgi:hypothetical protein